MFPAQTFRRTFPSDQANQVVELRTTFFYILLNHQGTNFLFILVVLCAFVVKSLPATFPAMEAQRILDRVRRSWKRTVRRRWRSKAFFL